MAAHRTRVPAYFLGIFIFASLFTTSCATVYNAARGHKEMTFIGSASEAALGRDVADAIEQKYKISDDPGYNERVAVIGERIAAASDRKDVRYFFKVIEDKEINAISTPGGFVYVNTGLLDKANDDELACVLGHEVGHIAARHAVKKIESTVGYSILANVAASQIKDARVIQTIDVSFDLIQRGYSREDELLADNLAVRYAYKAGYDFAGMTSFLYKLKGIEEKDPFSAIVLLRTHPKASDRIKNAQAQVQKITAGSVGFGRKFCPSCGHYYPESIGRCPKDGAQLKFRETIP